MRPWVLAVITLLASTSAAYAGPLDITNIVGGWLNAVPPEDGDIVNVGGQGTDTARWGDADGLSGYDFTPGADILGALLDMPLLLGTFTHINKTITPGTQIESIQYAFGFSTNGVPNQVTTTFNFAHDETPNPKPDEVTVSSLDVNQVITVGGSSYVFKLLGFSLDNGLTFSTTFISPENQSNVAKLYGTVSAVPEPSSILFVSAGVAMLVTQVRRRRT